MTNPRDTAAPAAGDAASSATVPSPLYGRLAGLPEALEPLAKPFYVVALLLIFIPAVDFWGTVSPMHLGEVRWRFGMLGILSGFFLTPLFGTVLLMAMAAMMEHGRVQLLAAGLNLLVGLLVIAALALFTLDAIQIRGEIGDSSVAAFDLVFMRTGGKLFVGALTFLWLARGGIRSYRRTRVPEGWQPGDPVPIVNTESVNIEGLAFEAQPMGERHSREMLISSDAMPIDGPDVPRAEALGRNMLLTPSSIPSLGNAPQGRRSEGAAPDILVNTDTVRVENPPTVAPRRVTKDMLIVGGDEPEKK